MVAGLPRQPAFTPRFTVHLLQLEGWSSCVLQIGQDGCGGRRMSLQDMVRPSSMSTPGRRFHLPH